MAPGSAIEKGKEVEIMKRHGAALALVVAALSSLLMPPGSEAKDEKMVIVALGDSLTAGLGLPPEQAYPALLQKRLSNAGYDYEVVNAGVSGDTASGGLNRLDWSVPPGTDAVILELGANDMLRGVDPHVTKTALSAIISKLDARHIPVLLAGMKALPNLGEDYARAFDAIYPALASTHHVVFYPFFLAGVAADPRLNLVDGMHPSPAGVDIIVKQILPSVEELIARVRTTRGS